MGSKSSSRFPAWQNDYDAALRETDGNRLAKCIEVAEANILVRREAIGKGANHRAEHEAIADALTQVDLLKRNRLGFYKYK
ncbi:MAG: hypothetical protein ABSG07_14710 [Terriglobales bacterium]|jgi:hypothetical protein